MKQHISVEKLNELSDKGKTKLRKWWKPEVGDINQDGLAYVVSHKSKMFKKTKDYPLLSCGQMIEFLGEPISMMYWYERQGWTINGKFYKGVERTDALWEACKEILK